MNIAFHIVPVQHAWGLRGDAIDRKRTRVTCCILGLQGCVVFMVQGNSLKWHNSEFSFLTFSHHVLVLLEDACSLTRVGHLLQTGLKLFKTKVFWKRFMYPPNSSRVPQIENPCSSALVYERIVLLLDKVSKSLQYSWLGCTA